MEDKKFEKIKKLSDKLKKYEKKLVAFDRDNEEYNFVPGHRPPLKEGYYVTIRCGLSGIYTVINHWKNGMWQMEVADDSRTIAYSRNMVDMDSIKKEIEDD